VGLSPLIVESLPHIFLLSVRIKFAAGLDESSQFPFYN